MGLMGLSRHPNLAAFLHSDESFMMYRSFGYLQARVLLKKQYEIRKLAAKLDLMDRWDAEHIGGISREHSRESCCSTRRKFQVLPTTKHVLPGFLNGKFVKVMPDLGAQGDFISK